MENGPDIHQALALINMDGTEWTAAEEQIAVKIKKKFANCARQKKRIPTTVFEANLKGNKSVNSDVAVIVEPGRKIYLPGRDPHVAFAGKLHLPGTTHGYETLAEATERLLDSELAMFGFKLNDLKWLGVLDLQDLPRAPTQSNLYVVQIHDIPQGLEKDFYAASEIPWDLLVVSHRAVTLPWLIEHDHL